MNGHVQVVAFGKAPKKDARTLAQRWHSRMTQRLALEFVPESQLETFARHRREPLVALDENGEFYSTERLARLIEHHGRRLVFCIGPSAGFSSSFLKRADYAIAISKLTLSRELAWLVLIEQIYRVFCMLDNHPYHRA